jgi:hypothetical protein
MSEPHCTQRGIRLSVGGTDTRETFIIKTRAYDVKHSAVDAGSWLAPSVEQRGRAKSSFSWI